MERKIKVITVLGLMVACSSVTLATMLFSPTATNWKWDKITNWVEDGVYVNQVPDLTDTVYPSWTDMDGSYGVDEINHPCWIRTWQQQGYGSDPGAGADAICRTMWFSGVQGQDANLNIDGDFSLRSFNIGRFWGAFLHSYNQVYIARTGSFRTSQIVNANYFADEYVWTLDGGFFQVSSILSPWESEPGSGDYSQGSNPSHYWDLIDGHMEVEDSFSSSLNPDRLTLNFIGPDADVVIQTSQLTDNLLPGGCLQANGVTVTPETASSLLRLFDTGDGYTAVMLASADPNKARSPLPADGAVWADYKGDLSFRGAVKEYRGATLDPNDAGWNYTVYFDDNPAFSSPTVIASDGPVRANNMHIATVTNAQIGGPLTIGTTYYWRVDTIDVVYGVTYQGDVWSFTAGAVPEMVSPWNSPIYIPTHININDPLKWNIDAPAGSHSRVYVTPEGGSPINCGIQTSPFDLLAYSEANPGTINLDWNSSVYSWQVVEEDASNNVIGESDIWQFAVRALNCNSTADLTDDCVVNMEDFAVMASHWLDCGWDDGGYTSPCP